MLRLRLWIVFITRISVNGASVAGGNGLLYRGLRYIEVR